MKRKADIEKKDQIMKARLQKMKEDVFDKQNQKEKENELKLLNEVLAREEKEKNKEKEEFLKHKREQMYFREFLAKQIQEK